MYRIAWSSTFTGVTGHGSWIFPIDLGKATMEGLDKAFPGIVHWMEFKDPEQPVAR
jgi:hypothetical protein